MSYCRFQNTVSDLRDCYDNFDNDLYDREFQARQEILNIAKSIVEDYWDTEFIEDTDE